MVVVLGWGGVKWGRIGVRWLEVKCLGRGEVFGVRWLEDVVWY